jgi:hypothetical protein
LASTNNDLVGVTKDLVRLTNVLVTRTSGFVIEQNDRASWTRRAVTPPRSNWRLTKRLAEDREVVRPDNEHLGRHDKDLGLADKEIGRADKDLGLGDEDLGLADKDLGPGDEDLGLADEDLGLGDEDLGVLTKDVRCRLIPERPLYSARVPAHTAPLPSPAAAWTGMPE